LVELYAEGAVSIETLSMAHEGALLAAEEICTRMGYPEYKTAAVHYATYAVFWATKYCDDHAASVAGWIPRAVARQAIGSPSLLAPGQLETLREIEREQERHAAQLVRHIFGNPFCPSAAPTDIPSAVSNLAGTLYTGEPCHFALHDALLDAGHAELAAHFREPYHPKGCWALDLILGKQ
jgi:hypothetical protein